MALPVQPRTIVAGVTVGSIGAGLLVSKLGRDVDADANAPRAVFGRGPAFVSLPLQCSEQVNHDTKRLRFALPHEADVSGLSLTSAVLTMSWPQGRWLPAVRPYTPISAINEPGVLELLVKQYPDGKQSTHLHSLKPGDKLLFAAAIRGHQWVPNSVPHVTLIAGGAGITPIFQLAQGILQNPDDKTAVTIVYGVNTDEDCHLTEEFQRFENEFRDRFRIVYTVSRPDESTTLRKGRVTKKLLEEVAPLPKGGETKVFVCGPPAMESSLVGTRKEKGILEQLGYRKDQIHTF
ncbi:oxidoreductase NAD-binding domain-containing protein [Bimuria novae-zelandiae CBS 107.79]|uniref:NADH-cytochrome b5 reductase n=1 Tax=Bimuria novae-zelandiae CBS 107.79 TaxID=1447943 RepID=A0A6A5UL88_9PLEO|nr:oxidoreductase NAD-binding domain-containing protein [Bimuria novae-zelandiae CBS 107.79]